MFEVAKSFKFEHHIEINLESARELRMYAFDSVFGYELGFVMIDLRCDID